MVVAEKWTGTDYDRRDMRKLRLDQVLRRNFGKLAMFGFSATLICTWEVILSSLSLSLGNGGTAGLFWTYIITAIFLTPVYASIAELGSMIPTSGGQYYWVAVMAPLSCRRYLSYVTGWLCYTSWQTTITGSAFLAGTIIQALFVLNIPGYNYQRWHGTLLGIMVVGVALVFNTLLARKLPLVEGILVFCHVLGVVIMIPLLVLLPRRVGGAPLVEFFNPNGWSSDGVSTMVGMLSTIIALLGFDCSIHLAEETKDSSRTMPLTLLTGFGVNAILGFFVLMTCIYVIGPLDVVLTQSVTGYPFVDMFYSATQSLAATDVMTTVVIINFTASAIAVVATASRQLWAFARNGGVPFSNWLAPKALSHDIPMNALAVSLVISILLLCINIGSSAALNAIFSIALSSLVTSYIITIGCILMARLQGRTLPPARYSLGKWGPFCNVISLLYLLPIFVFSFFPPVPLPFLTPTTMNWGIVMYGGVIIISTVYYVFWGRFSFTPPKDTIEDLVTGRHEMFGQSEKVTEIGSSKDTVTKHTGSEIVNTVGPNNGSFER